MWHWHLGVASASFATSLWWCRTGGQKRPRQLHPHLRQWNSSTNRRTFCAGKLRRNHCIRNKATRRWGLTATFDAPYWTFNVFAKLKSNFQYLNFSLIMFAHKCINISQTGMFQTTFFPQMSFHTYVLDSTYTVSPELSMKQVFYQFSNVELIARKVVRLTNNRKL